MHKKNVRAILLIISTFTYLMMGAAVFDVLESHDDLQRRITMSEIRSRMFRKYNFSESDFRILEAVVIKSIPHKAGYQWQFAGAFYFATVVITTVGYGHSCPSTFFGKAFCMIFALAGIPLGLVTFQSIGERVNTLIAYLLLKLRHWMMHQFGGRLYWLPEISPTHLLIVSLSIGTFVIALGTYVFHRYEDWSIFESYYYCVMTLSTIGFGDYVALQTDNKLQQTGYVTFTLIFILFGLSIFSACVNLLVLRFMATNMNRRASDRDPPRTIVLETFASDENGIDNHHNRHRQHHRRLMLANDRQKIIIDSKRCHRPSPTSSNGLCAICRKTNKNRTKILLNPQTMPYEFCIRRMPSNRIDHLLSIEAATIDNSLNNDQMNRDCYSTTILRRSSSNIRTTNDIHILTHNL